MMKSLIAVIIGGSVGCAIRWLLSVRLNALWSRPCRLETADHYGLCGNLRAGSADDDCAGIMWLA